MKLVPSANHRPLKQIAAEIYKDWTASTRFGPPIEALQYLEAMFELDQIEETYGLDTARSVVLYFLSNAGGYRGETARRIKLELKGIVDRMDNRLADKRHRLAYERPK